MVWERKISWATNSHWANGRCYGNYYAYISCGGGDLRFLHSSKLDIHEYSMHPPNNQPKNFRIFFGVFLYMLRLMNPNPDAFVRVKTTLVVDMDIPKMLGQT